MTVLFERRMGLYLFHDAHIAMVEKIGPHIADVLVMDYWTTEN